MHQEINYCSEKCLNIINNNIFKTRCYSAFTFINIMFGKIFCVVLVCRLCKSVESEGTETVNCNYI